MLERLLFDEHDTVSQNLVNKIRFGNIDDTILECDVRREGILELLLR